MRHILPSEVVKHIDRTFGWIINGDDGPLSVDHAPEISVIITLIDAVPEHLLTARSERYAALLSSLGHLRYWLTIWPARGSSASFKGGPLRSVRQVLAQCPDEFPAPTTHHLPFVTDASLRESLRLDIEHVARALANSEWKAATVLAGSVIEALLLWKLGTLPPADVDAAAKTARNWKAVRPLNEWHLSDYIEVAAIVPPTHPFIVADTVDLLRVVKNYRNLIHPGRAERLAQTCDKRTAYAAVAGMEGVVLDLSA